MKNTKAALKISKRPSKALLLGLSVLLGFGLLLAYGLFKIPGQAPSPLVGKPAPHFAVLQQWVVVNFWSSSCLVCRSEAPELEAFYQASLKPQGLEVPVQFVSVNIRDTTRSIQLWQQDLGQTFPVVEDTSGRISLDYGVTGTPETFLIDPQGVVRYRAAGPLTFNQLTAFIPWLAKHPDASWRQMTQFLFNHADDTPIS